MATAPLKPDDISLGSDHTTRTRRTAVFEWSDDNEILVAPPPSTEAPPRNTRAEVQSKRGEEVPEQRAREVPEQQATGVPEQQAMGAPKQQAEEILERRAKERMTVEKMGPPSQSTAVDPTAMPRGSGRQRRFKKLYRQTKP